MGFPCGSVGKESTRSAGDLDSIPGLGRFPWRREKLPTPVFCSGEFHGLYSPWGCKESDMTDNIVMWNREIKHHAHIHNTHNLLGSSPDN